MRNAQKRHGKKVEHSLGDLMAIVDMASHSTFKEDFDGEHRRALEEHIQMARAVVGQFLTQAGEKAEDKAKFEQYATALKERIGL